jgi:hypothetical protein
MRTAIFTVFFLASCQPILIGSPNGTAGSSNQAGTATSTGNAGSNGSGATTTTSGGATTAGGAAGSNVGGTAAGGSNPGSATAGAANVGESGAGGASNEADEGVLEARVLFVIYDPMMAGVTDPAKLLSTTLGVSTPLELGKQLAEKLEALTLGHVRHIVADESAISESFPPTLDAFRYDAAAYNACLQEAQVCHLAMADYQAIQSELDLCTLADDQNADQIWLFGAKRFGFAMGKRLDCPVITGGQTATRTVDFINLDYSEGLPSLLASYQAYGEYALQQAFGAPAANATDEPSHWLENLPRARWSDAQGRLKDDWRYILHPLERETPAEVSVMCSSSYLPGWCAQAKDKVHGECNTGEWATYMDPTGFVEFRFVPPKTVSAVKLYDRACDEQVLSGHLEFSDGSPDRAFGALEARGVTPLQIPFEPKLLTGLRVVIEDSSQSVISGAKVNPGFSEIALLPEQP